MVLAAGFGTRLLPLTRETPKPLMPLWGRPLLDHLLRMLRIWGVEEVLINLHHRPDVLASWLWQRPADGLRLTLSYEPEILGTGGGLAKASWFFGREPFWLVNADVAADLDPTPFIQAMHSGKNLAAVWLDEHRGPRTVEMRKGAVRCFQSPTPGAPGTGTFCGLHLLSPRILDYLPPEGFSTIVAGYEQAMKNGERIAGLCQPASFWADIGTPEQYLDAHRETLEAWRQGRCGKSLVDPSVYRRMSRARRTGVRIEGFAALGQNVVAAPGATICDSVIWDGARLSSSAEVRDAVVGRDTPVQGGVRRLILRGAEALEPGEKSLLSAHGWTPEQTTAQYFGARGSARSFVRLRHKSAGAILVHYRREREENLLYARHTQFLAGIGLRVPALLADEPSQGLSLYEDLGDRSLQEIVRTASAPSLLRHYERVLDAVWLLHSKGTSEARRQNIPLMPPFTPTLYEWERQYFIEHLLQKRLAADGSCIRRIRRELEEVARQLLRAPPVLIHRDLQSSNILWAGREPALIDYQGMRLGAAVYDLASLLCDPYVSLSEALQNKLLDYYAQKSSDPESIRRLFWWAAVQRLAQALGAYARLSAQPGMAGFAVHIVPAAAMLRRALERLSAQTALPTLQTFAAMKCFQ
ncbi:MAG: hypothetical protein A2X46_00200 [Lentisphaerae bacterium GWF2_57_35]|nr:MAG: hypothetical protein A2X46_00200 [Lentisphaerae bacterium GWF2_57_35]